MTVPALRRILIIEDDLDILAVMQLALEHVGGFSVMASSSGMEALSIAPTFAPDLILLDVMMPQMDGPTTFKALRDLPTLATTPIIFITAKVSPRDVAWYKELGALDVLAKPFDPLGMAMAIRSAWERHHIELSDYMQTQLAQLRESYKVQLPTTIGQIEQLWAELLRDGWLGQTIDRLLQITHSLIGSSSTFGFFEMSDRAYALEQLLQSMARHAILPTSDQRAQIAVCIDTLKRAYATIDRTFASQAPHQAWPQPLGLAPVPAAPASGSRSGPSENRLIFVADISAAQASDLALQIRNFGYATKQFAGLDALLDALRHYNPAALIIDTALLASDSAGRLAMQRSSPNAPALIFTSTHDELATRLQAVRAGGDAFFTIPISIGELIDKLDALVDKQEQPPAHIMIVDDEIELARYYALTLEQAGLITSIVTEPMGIMHALAEFMPDIILLDIYMAHCNGLELAAVIRQQEAYVSIPIVFLSKETNLDMQLHAMHQGGDDFLTKPIWPSQLISAVSSRVKRAQALRTLMIRDSLTGLLKHTVIKERLAAEMARTQRQARPLAFVMIDIDHFKAVNDTYGHAAGDLVIKSLARLLQQRLRKSDMIGRYGGEEFAVILPDTDGTTALQVLDELRSSFAYIRQQSGEQAFFVTFSAGIAEGTRDTDSNQLIEQADHALYQAKRAGRDRVMLADRRAGAGRAAPPPPDGTPT